MSWLDLGWLKRGDAWEFHPWGPFSRGYQLAPESAETTRRKVRCIRGGMAALVAVALVPMVFFQTWWPLLSAAVLGGTLEAIGIWWVVRRELRTESALGWENGLLYLACWLNPKLLLLARLATLCLVVVAVYLVIQSPRTLGPYLLLLAFVALQFVLNYLQQVERGSRR